MFARSAMLDVTDGVMPALFLPQSQQDSRQAKEEMILSQWLEEAACLRLSDYAPEDDILVLAYDAAAHPDPHIVLEHLGDSTSILLNGYELAIVNGKLSLDDLQLLPL